MIAFFCSLSITMIAGWFSMTITQHFWVHFASYLRSDFWIKKIFNQKKQVQTNLLKTFFAMEPYWMNKSHHIHTYITLLCFPWRSKALYLKSQSQSFNNTHSHTDCPTLAPTHNHKKDSGVQYLPVRDRPFRYDCPEILNWNNHFSITVRILWKLNCPLKERTRQKGTLTKINHRCPVVCLIHTNSDNWLKKSKQ